MECGRTFNDAKYFPRLLPPLPLLTLFLETRKRYNLEAHWSAPTRPFAVYRKGSNDRKSEEKYQDSLDELCNQYPPPQDDDDDDELERGGEVEEEGVEGSESRGAMRLTQTHSSGFVFSKPPKDFPK